MAKKTYHAPIAAFGAMLLAKLPCGDIRLIRLDNELLDQFDGTTMLPSDPLDPDFDPNWTPDKGKTK